MKGIVEEVQGHKTLRIFNISNNQVGDVCAGVIGDYIRTNHTVTEFYCENNAFTSKGDSVILKVRGSSIAVINMSKALSETYASALTVFNLKSSGVVKAEIDLFLKKSKERLEKFDRLEKSGKLSLADFTDSEVMTYEISLKFQRYLILPIRDLTNSLIHNWEKLLLSI